MDRDWTSRRSFTAKRTRACSTTPEGSRLLGLFELLPHELHLGWGAWPAPIDAMPTARVRLSPSLFVLRLEGSLFMACLVFNGRM